MLFATSNDWLNLDLIFERQVKNVSDTIRVYLVEREIFMTLYADSTYPVREDVDAIHTRQIEQLGSPGTWGAGEQRLAIVNEAR